MTETTTPSEEASVTFHVKSANNAKYTLTLPLSTTAVDLKNKLSTPEYANVPPASQRLIYSGRVLKDEDTLASHKVKDGNTMHLVKSAASNQRQNPASQSTPSTASPASTPQATGVPQNIAAGTGNNPLAGLTGARYAGFAQLPSAEMFGPNGGMGPPPSADDVAEMLNNPQTAQLMNEALQNPQIIDMMIQQNPQLRAMGPQARQLLQSEQFRRMMTDPQMMRSMAQMSRAFGMGPLGGESGGGNAAFPAPGVTNTTPQENQGAAGTDSQATNGQANNNPFSLYGQGGGPAGNNPLASLLTAMNPPPSQQNQNPSSPASNNNTTTSTQNTQSNPFAMLFDPTLLGGQQPTQGTNPSSNASAQGNPFALQNNPFLNDPAAFQNLLQAMGGGATAGGSPGSGANVNPFQQLLGTMGGNEGFGAPADSRPPEERYATQLRQLNEMGFFDFDRNIQALSRSGGDVNGALEWLFSQPQR